MVEIKPVVPKQPGRRGSVIVIIPKDFVDAGYVVVGRKHKINIELMDEEPLD